MANLKVPAIRYSQGGHSLYSFVLDVKKLPEIASVSHLHRDNNGVVNGFQRPEVTAHIMDIKAYLDSSASPMIPNSIILGFTKGLKFSPLERGSDLGYLNISGANGLVVDGQQRSAAVRDCKLEEFAMNVVAFVTESDEELNEHFVRVNNSKPLPKSILYELIPTFTGEITAVLEKKRTPILILDRLQRDEDSPFRGVIKTSTNPNGYVKDSTMLRMLESSLSEGYLWNLKATGDIEGMIKVLKNYWAAVADIFAHEWALGPKESRLLQTAGLLSMGGLMDGIGDLEPIDKLTKAYFAKWLKKIRPYTHFTEGEWDLGPDGKRPHDGIENTGKGVSMLTNYLVRLYKTLAKKGDSEISQDDAV